MKIDYRVIVAAVFIFTFFYFGSIGFPKRNLNFNVEVPQDVYDYIYSKNDSLVEIPDYITISKYDHIPDIIKKLKDTNKFERIAIYNQNCDPATYMQVCKWIGGDKNFAVSSASERSIARHMHEIFKNETKGYLETPEGKFLTPFNSVIIKAAPIKIRDVDFVLSVYLNINKYEFYLFPNKAVQYNRIFYPYIISTVELAPKTDEINIKLLEKNMKPIINDFVKKYNIKDHDGENMYYNKSVIIQSFSPKELSIRFSNDYSTKLKDAALNVKSNGKLELEKPAENNDAQKEEAVQNTDEQTQEEIQNPIVKETTESVENNSEPKAKTQEKSPKEEALESAKENHEKMLENYKKDLAKYKTDPIANEMIIKDIEKAIESENKFYKGKVDEINSFYPN